MSPRSATGGIDSRYAPLVAALAQRGAKEAGLLRARLRRSIREARFADAPADGVDHRRRPMAWDLEPVPLIIAVDEWRQLEAALKQRTRFVNALLADLYSRQEALRQRLLPPEMVLTDPFFRRPAMGLDPERPDPATLLRFDLVKTSTGWHFADTHVNTPIGLAFVVQNRRLLTQEAGELYRALPDYHRISNFPLLLLDALKALARRTVPAPSIVMLTAGPRDPVYLEHSYLARKMGVPLARGDDLLVLDNRVYFKTIAGLERVDVIYRRLNDAHIDPVVLATPREAAGVPGLLQCIRHGQVAVANAIGTGLAEHRALHAFLPQLMRFYLGEEPLLPAVPTWCCTDPDLVDVLFDRRDKLQLRPAHGPTPGIPAPAPDVPLSRNPQLAEKLRQSPYAWVIQQYVEPVPLLPVLPVGLPSPLRLRATPARLSAFALCSGRDITVLPGGLVFVGSDLPPPEEIGTTADTVILAEAATKVLRAGIESAESTPDRGSRRLVLGSSAAENLCWLGRYLERAESTARMLSILEDVLLEEIPFAERNLWLPLWQGVLEATGHASARPALHRSAGVAFSADRLLEMALDDRHAARSSRPSRQPARTLVGCATTSVPRRGWSCIGWGRGSRHCTSAPGGRDVAVRPRASAYRPCWLNSTASWPPPSARCCTTPAGNLSASVCTWNAPS